MKAKKSLGQNFLMHQATAERIADASGVGKEDVVLEIGPGTGMLTRALLSRVRRVIAVETDGELIPVLETMFEKEIAKGRLELIHADIRSFTPSSINEPYALVANIPYYITGEIIRQFLSTEQKPSSMTLLVQKEVAERIVRSKKESLLSLSVKVYGTPVYRFTVSKGSFKPAPSVDSAVLSITNIKSDAFNGTEDEECFFKTLRAGFAHKRKLLRGNLTDCAAQDKVVHAMEIAGIPEKARAEDVGLQKWRILAKNLGDNAHI
jgi:16S rRNA (adenine1518-N6/adenine1519-N6)-dimethyltransferase